MEITDVRIRKISSSDKMKAIVSITFDDMFVVHDIKIIEGPNGLFIDMPSRRAPGGRYRDIAHPINAETRAMIQDTILRTYSALDEALPPGVSVTGVVEISPRAL